MITLLIILQFAIVVVICIAVLLQKSSSIGLGAYSGSNESLFGAKGPAGFLAKFTFVMGIILIANTIALSYMYNNGNNNSLAEKAEQILPEAPDANTTIPVAPSAPISETNSSK
ncbi:preprotein translocase subunit SecG [Campylobacter peloridis]|uniref:preprotein translocase subunit SecG n=1 Tax=Campylobacter peloridis TaxID=488546 RepID=UPI001C739233|nr:preprotein translocase subunit SecG [Campylobacter peloridis]MBX1885580.1 preprotein translocase subunit SecG [Campylobacter peloridis]